MTNRRQSVNNLKALKKRVSCYYEEIKKDADRIGMTEKTLERLVQGTDIIICPTCHTPNMYQKDKAISSDVTYFMYMCDECHEYKSVKKKS